jgi:DNA helicase HerA-like ATPase
MGKRRSGKSYTLGVIAEGLISHQWINQMKEPQAVLVFDTLNVFWGMQYPAGFGGSENTDELTKWGVKEEKLPADFYYPHGYKMEYYPEEFREFSLSLMDLEPTDWCFMFQLDPIVDPLGQLFMDVISSMKDKRTFSFSDIYLRLESLEVKDRYEPKTLDAAYRRAKSLEMSRVFSSKSEAVSGIFKDNRISVLLLRDLEPELRTTVIGVITRKLFQARGMTDECEKRLSLLIKTPSDANRKEISRLQLLLKKQRTPRGWILIDEAHNYVPAVSTPPSKGPLVKYVKEGRNIGLSAVFATQSPSALDASIQANLDIGIVHNLSREQDISAAYSMRNTADFERAKVGSREIKKDLFQEVVRDLTLGYCVVSSDTANRLFAMKVRPRISIHGGKEY